MGIARSFIQILEFRKNFVNPYETYLHSYLTHRYALLRLRGIHLISHPLIIYRYSGFPFISSAPFIYIHKDVVYAYNTIIDQYLLDPLKIGYSGYRAYPLNMSTSIIVNSMDVPQSIVRGSIEEGLWMETVNDVSTAIDVYSIGFDNRILFVDDKHRIYRAVTDNGDVKYEDYLHCKSLHSLKHSYFKALVCSDGTVNFIVISDGVYGTEFSLDRKVLTPPNTIFYLYLNIAYMRLADSGILLYCLDNSCKTIEIEKELRPLAMLSNNTILSFIDNYLALYYIDEKRIAPVLNIRPEDIKGISIDPYKCLILLSTSDNIYLFDLNTISFIKIPSKRSSLGYISDRYMLLLGRNKAEIYFIENGSKIHIERISSSNSYIVKCSSIGKGDIVCIDRAGRIVFINLDSIDQYINQHLYTLRDDSDNISIAAPDIAPYAPLRLESYREIPYSIHRIDTLKGVIRIAADYKNYKTESFHETLLRIQGILKEYKSFVNLNKGARTHSEKPSEIKLSKAYIINRVTSSSMVFTPSESLSKAIDDGEDVLLIRGEDVVRGFLKNGVIEFNGVSKMMAEEPVYVAKKIGDIVLGQIMRASTIDRIDIDKVINTVHHIGGDGIEICIDTTPLKNSGIEIFTIDIICSNRIVKSNTGCADISSCENVLLILIEIALDRERENTITIPIRYNRSPYIEFVDGFSMHLNEGPYSRVRIPYNCTYFSNAYVLYDDKLKIHIDIGNRCVNVPVYLALQGAPHIIEPEKMFRLLLPLNLDDIVRGYTSFVIVEPSGVRLVNIDIQLKNILAYTNRIALKIATLLGIRSSVQKRNSNPSAT